MSPRRGALLQRKLLLPEPGQAARPRSHARDRDDVDELVERGDASLLDLVDNLLARGAVLNAEAVLSVAGVDLVYLRLTALLCAADRVLPHARPKQRKR